MASRSISERLFHGVAPAATGVAVVSAVAAVITLPLPAAAALAPVYQNPKDLAVMVQFVHRYPDVMAGLRVIDLMNKVVLFGNGCVAQFGRKPSPPGIVGPAPELQFVSSNCPLGPEQGGPR